MKFFYFLIVYFLTINAPAQWSTADSIVWSLATTDTVTSSSPSLRGKNQNRGSDISGVSYTNGYQMIYRPQNGWPSTPVSSNDSYLDFPFAPHPDQCWDTTGGNRLCTGYSYYYPNLLELSAYVQQADSAVIDVYFYDTSCYSNYYGNYKHLRNFTIKSDNGTQPTHIQFRTSNDDPKEPQIHACGAGGRYSAIRLYPRAGGDLFVKNLIIRGFAVSLLPITFKFMRGVLRNEAALLNWQIDNLQDLKNFIIEKSTDGRRFQQVETITEAANQPYLTGSYSWQDKAKIQFATFYRVKAIEKTGKVSVSKVVKIEPSSKSTGVQLLANPISNNTIQLTFNNTSAGIYEVIIRNQVGAKIFSNHLKYNGTNSASIRLPGYVSKGIYYLTIRSESFIHTEKIIIP